jgi:hypothetical protein
MVHDKETYLEGNPCKGINITRSRRAIGHMMRGKTYRDTFRGHISEEFRLVVVAGEKSKHTHYPKVPETCLAFPSNQDVALEIPSVNVRDHSFICLVPGQCYHVK